MPPIVYHPNDLQARTNPWPVYQRLRDEAPVALMPANGPDGHDFYVISRYEDAAMALRDSRRFSSHMRRGDFLDMPVLLNRDAPDHTKLRRIINRALGPRTLAPHAAWLQGIVDDLVAELLEQPRVEFVDQFTTTLPLRVVGTLLGFPLDRKADLLRWSRAVAGVFAVAGGTDPDEVAGFYEDFMELVTFIDQLAAERAGSPDRGDILSDLARRESAGEVDRDEVVGLGWSIIIAGSDTAANLLAGGTELLIRDQALAARLAAGPERTDDFMEEFLRLYSPQQWVARRVNEDVTLHGVTMPEGSIVHIVLGSANRDPRKFANPDVFDMDRPNIDDHMAFGGGRHFCPGAALGREFSGVAFRSLYPHVSRFSLDPAQPPRLRTGPGNYGIEHMDIRIGQPEPAIAGV